MTYDVAHLTHELAEEGLPPQKASLSRAESIDSISGEANGEGYCSSDELDKLSSCLSEGHFSHLSSFSPPCFPQKHPLSLGFDMYVNTAKLLDITQSTVEYYVHSFIGYLVSNDSGSEIQNSVFYDIAQAQVGLWTCVFSLLYSYAWGQHRKKFLMSIFFVVPTVFFVCCAISALLTAIVIIGRIFSTEIAYKQFLNLEDRLAECTEDIDFAGLSRRHRLNSGASDISITSDEYLPKPLCRRHSGSHTSLCHSRPPSVNRKLSYAFSHQNAVSDDESP